MGETNATRFPWEPEGEVVVFETPEQTRIEHRIAPFGSRLVANMLDQLLLAVLSVLLWGSLIAGLVLMGNGLDPDQFLYLLAAVLAFQFLLNTSYFVWAEMRAEGRTWGKRRMGIRTLMATGRGVTLGASVIRNLARLVDNIPVLWIVPALNRGNRRLGDLLAGTLVVAEAAVQNRTEPEIREKPLAASYRELADRKFYFSSEAAARLYPDDLNLIEHLQVRLASALPTQRKRTLEEVARKYIERLSLQEEEARILDDPSRFLQEMVLFLRDRFEGQAF